MTFRARINFALVVSCLVVGLCAWLFGNAQLGGPSAGVVCGILAIVIRLAISGLFIAKPMIVVDETGLSGHRIKSLIKWEDIRAIETQSSYNGFGYPLWHNILVTTLRGRAKFSLKDLSASARDVDRCIFTYLEAYSQEYGLRFKRAGGGVERLDDLTVIPFDNPGVS